MAKNTSIISAIGVSGYTWLNKPDTKFNEKGVFHVTLNYDGDEDGYDRMVEQIQAEADVLTDAWKADPKNKKYLKDFSVDLPIKDVKDDDGEETGQTSLKFKTYATSKDGKPKKVKIRDSRDKPCAADIRSGSRLRVMFNLSANFIAKEKVLYITCYIIMVQVIELGEGGGGGGFGAVEGGFVGSDREDREDDRQDDTSGSDDSQDDDSSNDDF